MTSKARTRVLSMQRKRAGIVSRVLANLIDFGTVTLIYTVMLATFGIARGFLTDHPIEMPDPAAWFTLVAIPTLDILYLTIGWAGNNRTLGKEIMGLRVVRPDGRFLSLPRSFVRAVVCVFVGAPLLLWSAVSKRNASVYDIFLRTAVIYDWPELEPVEPVELDAADR
jgi:uncharacterized RDD family membrane protein YckC